jgi:hypothetical protein
MRFPGEPMKTPAIMGIAAALVLGTGSASAEWRVVTESPPDTDAAVEVALVDNDSGHSLRIFRDDEFNVRGVFTIRGGFDTIDQDGCPTYRVDKREPVRVSFHARRCVLEAKRAEFTLGTIGDPNNWQLRQLIFGSDIVFRYRLDSGGYRETAFTLRRSKQALQSAIGQAEIEFDE